LGSWGEYLGIFGFGFDACEEHMIRNGQFDDDVGIFQTIAKDMFTPHTLYESAGRLNFNRRVFFPDSLYAVL